MKGTTNTKEFRCTGAHVRLANKGRAPNDKQQGCLP